MKLSEVRVGMKVISKTSGIHAGQRGKVLAVVDSPYETGKARMKLVRVEWGSSKIADWHPIHLEAAK